MFLYCSPYATLPPATLDRRSYPRGWGVDDANGPSKAYVYGHDRHKGVSDASMTVDDARRIVVDIATLSERIPNKTTPPEVTPGRWEFRKQT
jgi:hypothetical protein